MIFNVYSYLFFSAMAAGSAMVVLINTLKQSNRALVWDISSITCLIQMIVSVAILFSGLIVAETAEITFLNSFLFYLAVFLLSTVSFYFIRTFTLPVVLFLLLGLFLYFHLLLSDFTPFDNGSSFIIKVLSVKDFEKEVEIQGFDNEIEFRSLGEEQDSPVFLVLDFPEYLFFLENPHYIQFLGFMSEEDDPGAFVQKNDMALDAFTLPFAEIRIHENLPIKETVYSSFHARLLRDGTLRFQNDNN
ncbi:MAG: hypothetical protein JEY91_06365 [Spirochaetaceae bacterium]|nr:hypothetical protein [Spirochaetaceae bacterium]